MARIPCIRVDVWLSSSFRMPNPSLRPRPGHQVCMTHGMVAFGIPGVVLTTSTRDIDKCLHTLIRMQNKWKGAVRCYAALSKLVGSLSKRQDCTSRAPSKRPRFPDDGAPSRKRPRPNQDETRNPSETLSAPPHISAHQSWPSDDISIGNDPLPGLDIGNGDMFQDILWDGDFSSIDQFTLHDFSQDWLK